MAELAKLLSQRKIRSELEKFANLVLASRENRFDPEMQWESQSDEDGWKDSARRILEPLVAELDHPAVCTVADLAEAFDIHLGIPPDRKAIDFDRFVGHLTWNARQHRRSNPIPVSTGWFDQLSNPTQIWTSKSGIKICLCGSLTQGSPSDRDLDVHPQRTLYLALDGPCTARALDAACQEAGDVIGALIDSFKLLTQASEADLADHSTLLVAMDDPLLHSKIEVCDESGNLLDDFALIPVCLDAYFQSSKKSNTLDYRIRIAIQLLVEADRQKHHSVGLALTMAALEAMLCNSKESIADRLSKNVAVLLEPDIPSRESAIRVVKDMYQIRSDVLHGTRAEATGADRRKARLLGAGVLRGLLEYQSLWKRLPESRNPSDLQKDLEKGLINAKSVIGVMESPARYLWKKYPP